MRKQTDRLEELASTSVGGKIESTTASPYLDYLAHCIGCRGTDRLALFAHRIEGQMVGWIFACPNCAPKVPRLQLDIQYVPGGQPDDDTDYIPLMGG